jgi:hypothetical protein
MKRQAAGRSMLSPMEIGDDFAPGNAMAQRASRCL